MDWIKLTDKAALYKDGVKLTDKAEVYKVQKVKKRSHTLIQSIDEVLIPFIGPSPHGMMNASALKTGRKVPHIYLPQTQGLLLVPNPPAE